MKIRFNRTGNERKELVAEIGDILETKPVYNGAPKFIYAIGGFKVDKEGTLIIDDCTCIEKVEHLLNELINRGFNFEKTVTPVQDSGNNYDVLIIEIPLEGFTEVSITNLKRIIESKGALIKKALGVIDLPIEETEGTLRFPWFDLNSTADEIKAYTHFISALCEMAKSQQRVTASSRDIDSEKYAFRCFLLRLGFIGSEYKNERKILLSKLTGSSAFKRSTPQKEEDVE